MSSDRPGHRLLDEDAPTSSPSGSSPAVSVTALIIAIVAVVISLFAPFHRDAKPKAPAVTMEQFTQLSSATDSLQNAVLDLQAHTDTTGMGDMRERVGNLTNLVESLHGRYDQLQIEFNRHDINTPHK